MTVLDLFPDTASIDDGQLSIGGATARALAAEHGTPLLVMCEETLRARAREYRAAAPDALLAYSVKAFPNVALLRLLAEEGFGADVSTGGELAYARAADIPGERIVVHGNNKADAELALAAGVDALVVIDAADDVERAAAAGVHRVLVRVTPGIDADTHDAIRTAHYGSKFGLPPDDALDAIARALGEGLSVEGVHVHVGSQLLDTGAARMAVDWSAAFAAECLARLEWTPRLVDYGGGLGIRHVPEEQLATITEFAGTIAARARAAWGLHGLEPPRVALEPGRSLVGSAGTTLYTVGVVKRASESATYVAIDGGMSDNPRPQLYGARYTGLLANRADEYADGVFTVCGKHCESGDVLIERLALPRPRRGDVLAVPATGAYTVGMSSNYNGVLRPATVLVRGGEARLIRRRETVDDLLGLEVP
jgi:diaminopimelate decarboxylase